MGSPPSWLQSGKGDEHATQVISQNSSEENCAERKGGGLERRPRLGQAERMTQESGPTADTEAPAQQCAWPVWLALKQGGPQEGDTQSLCPRQ